MNMNNLVKVYPKISFFNGPITNLTPKTTISLADVYRGVTSNYYKQIIEQIRLVNDDKEKRNIKKQLDYVTFAGVFKIRNCNNLIKPSGYICIDLDHIEGEIMASVKKRLLNDSLLETALLFTSPGGRGLKWVVEVNLNRFDYATNYEGVIGYLRKMYRLDDYIDTKAKDVARACFMSYDPDAYINPKYKN
jgi:hypothetical protein